MKSLQVSLFPFPIESDSGLFGTAIGELYSFRNVIVRNEPSPKPMLLPDKDNFFDGNALGLRQEEEDKGGHADNPKGEEVEEAELHMAQHGQEGLGY